LAVVTNEDAECEYEWDSAEENDWDNMDGETITHSADLTGLPEGEIEIEVYCEDPAGNYDYGYITFTVTDELPQTSSTVVDPYYTSEDPTITAQVESETSAIQEAKYCLRRPWVQRPVRDATIDCYDLEVQDDYFDEFKETVEETIDISSLDEGIWVAYTNALDSVDWGEYDAELFTVDTIPPIVDELEPEDGEMIQGEEYDPGEFGRDDIILRAETNEPASCEYDIDEEGWQTFEKGEWTHQHESDEITLDDGTYEYEVCCVDYTNSDNGETCEIAVFEIDSIAPTTTMDALPTYSKSSFIVSWSATDVGVGVDSYTVEYNLNSGGWTPWKVDTEDTEDTFTAEEGDDVEFRAKAKDKVANEGSYSSTVSTTIDSLPPEVISSSPTGTVTSSGVILSATTDENADCEYKLNEEFNYGTGTAFATTGGTVHTQTLTLEDGDYTYHVRCIDLTAGNAMTYSAIIDFDIDTSSNFGFAEWLYPVWDVFSLPKIILQDLGFSGTDFETSNVLTSLNTNYDWVYYYDGTQWLFYDPSILPMYSTLITMEDTSARPYYIKMNTKDRLEVPKP